jgi:hypothetical protein
MLQFCKKCEVENENRWRQQAKYRQKQEEAKAQAREIIGKGDGVKKALEQQHASDLSLLQLKTGLDLPVDTPTKVRVLKHNESLIEKFGDVSSISQARSQLYNQSDASRQFERHERALDIYSSSDDSDESSCLGKRAYEAI